jgi:hypothetical protein
MDLIHFLDKQFIKKWCVAHPLILISLSTKQIFHYNEINALSSSPSQQGVYYVIPCTDWTFTNQTLSNNCKGFHVSPLYRSLIRPQLVSLTAIQYLSATLWCMYIGRSIRICFFHLLVFWPITSDLSTSDLYLTWSDWSKDQLVSKGNLCSLCGTSHMILCVSLTISVVSVLCQLYSQYNTACSTISLSHVMFSVWNNLAMIS